MKAEGKAPNDDACKRVIAAMEEYLPNYVLLFLLDYELEYTIGQLYNHI